MRIHPVFHVSQIKPQTTSPLLLPGEPPPPPLRIFDGSSPHRATPAGPGAPPRSPQLRLSRSPPHQHLSALPAAGRCQIFSFATANLLLWWPQTGGGCVICSYLRFYPWITHIRWLLADLSQALVSREAAPTGGPIKRKYSRWAPSLHSCPSLLIAAIFKIKTNT